jgi:hypothetical protein
MLASRLTLRDRRILYLVWAWKLITSEPMLCLNFLKKLPTSACKRHERNIGVHIWKDTGYLRWTWASYHQITCNMSIWHWVKMSVTGFQIGQKSLHLLEYGESGDCSYLLFFFGGKWFYLFIYLFISFIHLFICVYIVWSISSPTPLLVLFSNFVEG